MSESIPTPEADMMRMSPWEFDQTPNGWRKLADTGELVKAAGRILRYISENKEQILNSAETEKAVSLDLLYFHRGQVLASAGQEYWEQAIESLSHSFEDNDECWNAYVAATIGFLENNMGKITQAIQTIESSKQEERRGGNIGIVRNFKKALEEEVRDYDAPYSWPKDESL